MRTSQFYLSTLKEAPAEAELASHRLMLRAGMIKRVGSGLYSWLPLGLRVLKKIENIIRAEMNRAGAQELLMPIVQPAELWKETGRWTQFGPQMLKIKDRHEHDFCFGPTHEEVITDLVRNELRSYKQLPIHFYQIQIKFRDEIRPRFGVMRAREFLMKDGYSFHANFESLQTTYQVMYETYQRIFRKLGLRFRVVSADTGSIGGSSSHEFHVLAEAGEDHLAYCPTSDFAANVELAQALPPSTERAPPTETMQAVLTPSQTQCSAVARHLDIPIQYTVKACALVTENGQFILALVRGDHTLNEAKLSKLEGDFRFATEAEIREQLGAPPGFIGPVGISNTIRIVADQTVAVMSDFVCGANRAQYHLRGVNWGRDLPEPHRVEDIRNVIEGDPSPDGQGVLQLCRGIEVGHIFQLRTQYSKAMACQFTDSKGQTQWMEMGCYGIGVSRIVSAAIEQNYDEKGICFPEAIAPFVIVIVPVAYHRSESVKAAADQLYAQLCQVGIDVLLDDRDERPGVLFADMDLIGIPHRLTISERSLSEGQVEYLNRRVGILEHIILDKVADFFQSQRICNHMQ